MLIQSSDVINAVAIPLEPQPVLRHRKGASSWAWAIQNQWMGQHALDRVSLPGENAIPMVGACWVSNIENPLDSGAGGMIEWAPYQKGWVIRIGGDDRIVCSVDVVQLRMRDNVVVYKNGLEFENLDNWIQHWVWLLELEPKRA